GTPGSAEDVLPGQQEAGVAGRPAKGAGMMDGEVESAETTAAQPGDAAELGTSGAVPGIERGDDVTDQPVLDPVAAHGVSPLAVGGRAPVAVGHHRDQRGNGPVCDDLIKDTLHLGAAPQPL